MKSCLLVVVMAIAGTQLAQADSKPDAPALGALQGMYESCAQVDPQHDGKYRELERSLVRGLSESEIDKLHANREFISSRDTLHRVLGEFTKPDLLKGCEDIPGPGEGHGDGDRDHHEDADRDHRR
jgi:hypothetical protein